MKIFNNKTNLYVDYPSGTILLSVDQTDSLSGVADKVNQRLPQYPLEKIKLYYNNQLLDPNLTLQDYFIYKNSTLVLKDDTVQDPILWIIIALTPPIFLMLFYVK
jgi:hypothetical protein